MEQEGGGGPTGTLTFPASLRSVGKGWGYDFSEIKFISPSPHFRVIKERAFYQSSLSSVELPEGVEDVDPSAFAKSAKLKSVVLPSTLEEIDGRDDKLGAFEACEKLTSVTFRSSPDRLELIGERAFKGTKLTSIDLGSSTGRELVIGESAFENSDLLSIRLPATMLGISKNAFKGTDLGASSQPVTIGNETVVAESAFPSDFGRRVTGGCFQVDEGCGGLLQGHRTAQRTSCANQPTDLQYERCINLHCGAPSSCGSGVPRYMCTRCKAQPDICDVSKSWNQRDTTVHPCQIPGSMPIPYGVWRYFVPRLLTARTSSELVKSNETEAGG